MNWDVVIYVTLYAKYCLKVNGAWYFFLSFCVKGRNFSDFCLLSLLQRSPLQKGSRFFSFRVDSFPEARQTNLDKKIISSESISISHNH